MKKVIPDNLLFEGDASPCVKELKIRQNLLWDFVKFKVVSRECVAT